MRISDAVKTLNEITAEFGDLEFVGGSVTDDRPINSLCVIDVEGHEIWPNDPNGVKGQFEVAGIFVE